MAQAKHEIDDDPRKWEVRIGGEDFPWEELVAMADKPGVYGINDWARFLHWDWHKMQTARAFARKLLRKKTGHTGDRERKFKGIVFQVKGQLLQAWQEERPKSISVDCLALGIYDEFCAAYPEFCTPITVRDNGEVVSSLAKAQETYIIDPAWDDVEGEDPPYVACGNLSMRRVGAYWIVHEAMDTMKSMPAARMLETEIDIKWRFHYGGIPSIKSPTTPTRGVSTSPRKKTKETGSRTLTVCDGNVADPETTCTLTPPLDQLLPRPRTAYPAQDGFPYSKLQIGPVWQTVQDMMSMNEDEDPSEKGWLRYSSYSIKTDQDGVRRKIAKHWNVEKGEQLGAVLQQHQKCNQDMVEEVPFRLYFTRGKCELPTQAFVATSHA